MAQVLAATSIIGLSTGLVSCREVTLSMTNGISELSSTTSIVDANPPVVTAFLVPAFQSSLLVSEISITATDNLAVTEFLLTESESSPAQNDSRWSPIAPTNHHFSSFGTKTLHAFAKDAAGNVSARKSAGITIAPPPPQSGSPSEPLLLQSNLVYQGAFRIPGGDFGSPQYSGFSYSGTAITYHPGNNSLYMVGHPYHNLVAEVSIPAIKSSGQLSELNTATVLQNFSDITEGNLKNINAGGTPYSSSLHVGGLLVFNGRLIGNVYAYYDAAHNAALSHFVSGLNLSAVGDFQGMIRVGMQNPGFVAGYMATIPPQWQALLGGPAMTGQAGIPIIGRSSHGPAATVFNPDDLGSSVSTVAATPVLGYPIEHPTLGNYGHTDAAIPAGFNMSTQINGAVFPVGSSTVLFFGRQGLGRPCYGQGTSDPSLDRQPVPEYPTVMYCYDPVSAAKGSHGYPYSMIIWAYNANDLVAAKKGQKNIWDVLPYDVWFPVLPIGTGNETMGGVGYDPERQLIYVSQKNGDPGTGYFSGPVIHVFKIQ